MNTEQQIRLGRKTAFVSFLLGTVFFGLYYLSSSYELLFIGYAFILLAGVFNLVVLITLLKSAYIYKKNRKPLLVTAGFLVCNIPIMIFYCSVAAILLDTMRISFTNETGVRITDVRIVGCGGAQIDKLEIHETQTVWVPITGDCSIQLEYLINGHKEEETVAGYVTSGMGQRIYHKIDGTDKDVF